MPVVPPALPARRSVTMRCWPLFAAAAAYLGTTGCVPACQLCRPSLALAPAGPGLVQTLPIQMQKNRGACASIPSTKRPPTRARPFDPNKQCQGRYHLRAVKQACRHQVAMRPVRRDAPPRSVPCAGHRREGPRRVDCSVGSEHCHVDCTPGKVSPHLGTRPADKPPHLRRDEEHEAFQALEFHAFVKGAGQSCSKRPEQTQLPRFAPGSPGDEKARHHLSPG